jgi:hypothetical protein
MSEFQHPDQVVLGMALHEARSRDRLAAALGITLQELESYLMGRGLPIKLFIKAIAVIEGRGP